MIVKQHSTHSASGNCENQKQFKKQHPFKKLKVMVRKIKGTHARGSERKCYWEAAIFFFLSI